MARVNTWEQGHTLKLGIAMIKTKGVDSVQFKNVAINEEAALVIVRSIKFKENYLKRLNLRNCRLGDRSGDVILKYLRDPASKIETLKLGGNGLRNLLGNVSSVLKVNRILEDLDLSSNLFEPAGFKVFEEGFGALRKFDVSQNELHEVGLISFAEGLRTNTTLRCLGLEEIDADRKGFSRLFECLEGNKTLETLYIGKNCLEEVPTERLSSFGRACSSLVTLDCNSCKLGELGGFALFSSLAETNSLHELDLANNAITTQFCIDAKEWLKRFTALTRLCISYNDISDSGVKELCEALRVQGTLISLDLTSNEITDVGAVNIADFISVDSALKELLLYRNMITARGAKHIAKALEKNHGVQVLDLGSNLLRDEGLSHLAKSLKKNTSLTVLNLDTNMITPVGLHTMVKCLQVNRSIVDIRIDIEGREEIEQQLDANLEERQKVAKGLILSTMGNIDKVKWNRVKVTVVGNSGSGKTSLVRSLLDKVFSARMPMTIGVDIQTLQKVKLRDGWERVHGTVYANDFEHIVTHAAALKLKKVRSEVKRDHKSLSLANLGKIAGESRSEPGIKPSNSMKERSRKNRYALLRNKTLIQKGGKRTRTTKLASLDSMPSEEASLRLSKQPNILKTFQKRLVEKVLDPEKDISDEYHPLTLSLWDFSGIDSFHPLIQPFLTTNGGSLVVFDMMAAKDSMESTGIVQWLQSLSLKAENNHVFIVGTHSSEVDISDIKANSLYIESLVRANQISAVKNEGLAFFPVDNKTGRGIHELQEAVHNTLRDSQFLEAEIPLKWIRCFELLVCDRPGAWLKFDLVSQIAESCHVKDPGEVEALLDLLRNLGLVAHVTATEGLKQYVITDPQWLLSSLAKMVNPSISAGQERHLSKHGFQEDMKMLRAKGILTLELMSRFWQAQEVNFMVDFLQRLLLLSRWRFDDQKSFNTGERYFLPSMSIIPEAPGAMETSSKSNRLIFDFAENGLPIGVFERLVALTIGFSSGIEKVPQPNIEKDWCKVWLGVTMPVLLRVDRDLNCIELVMPSTTENHNPSRSMSVVRSMMSKIKEDVFGQGLKWELVYMDPNNNRLSLESAATSPHFAEWFSDRPEEQAPQRHVDLEIFLEVV